MLGVISIISGVISIVIILIFSMAIISNVSNVVISLLPMVPYLLRFPTVYLYDNLLWPPVQMINFTLVPCKYRCRVTGHGQTWN